MTIECPNCEKLELNIITITCSCGAVFCDDCSIWEHTHLNTFDTYCPRCGSNCE